jgi:uncharacterized membrane protein
MGSAVLPPITMEAMKQNMVWDGWFHALTWVVSLTGVYMLRAERLSRGRSETTAAFTGQLIFGWGAFNLVEGVIDHHLLDLHHVRDMPLHVPAYDWLFLAVGGVGLLGVGWVLTLRSRTTVAGA